MTPQKYPQNLHTPKNINFSENPQKYWNGKFRTQNNDPRLRMYKNIRLPPPPPPPPPPWGYSEEEALENTVKRV